MDSIFTQRKQYLLIKLIAGAILGVILLQPPGLPREGSRAPSSGRSSGSRGCGISTVAEPANIPALILLVPNHGLKQTVSSSPSFAWFVRDQGSAPLEFRLYEQQQNSIRLVKEMHLKSSSGIMVILLNQAMPELAIGKRYRWQVELICNPNRPSGNPFAESEFEVVAMQPHLKTRLMQTRDRLEQAMIFEQETLWYDLLGRIFSQPGSSRQLRQLQLSLLNKVATNSTEQKLLHDSAIHVIHLQPVSH